MRNFAVIVGACALSLLSYASAQPVALVNARILTATDTDEIPNGTVIFDNGKIVAVGAGVAPPRDAQVMDMQGKTITPGLVAANVSIGAVEISGGADAAEMGSGSKRVTAGYDVQYAINPYSPLFAVTRQGGVTRAIVTPGGGDASLGTRYAGQAAVIRLGEGPDVVLRPRAGVVWSLGVGEAGRGAAFVQFQAELKDVRRYARRRNAFERGELRARDWSEADLEALIPVVEGKEPLVASVDRASDILALLDLAAREKIKLILVGASEGWLAADAIAKAGVPVILDVTENLPSNFNQIGATLDNARLLHEAGVTLVIQGKRTGHEARQLRYFAGLAVAHGLPYTVALKAVTVNPARVWGEKGFGAITAGQEADLAIWDGDPFEPLTDLTVLYISGERQSLRSRQDMLEERYINAARRSGAERSAD